MNTTLAYCQNYNFDTYYLHEDDLTLMVFGEYEQNLPYRTPVGILSITDRKITNSQELPSDVLNEPDLMRKLIPFSNIEQAIEYINNSPKNQPSYWNETPA